MARLILIAIAASAFLLDAHGVPQGPPRNFQSRSNRKTSVNTSNFSNRIQNATDDDSDAPMPKILYSRGPSRGKREADSPGKVYFPGYAEITKKDIKPCPNGKLVCEDVDDYPETQLREVLENSNGEFNDILGKDSLHEPVEIGTRNDFSMTMTMCDSDERVIFPKRAQTKENRWMHVINLPKYEQGVRIEVCRNETSNCHFSNVFPLGYEATCKQKFIFRKLLAADPTGTTTVEEFRLPSCCSCSIKAPGLGTRFGFDNDSLPRKRN